MANIKEYINYKRIETPVHGGVRIFYQHKLTNEIFCDGFHLGSGNRLRMTREGERLFDLLKILQRDRHLIKVTNS